MEPNAAGGNSAQTYSTHIDWMLPYNKVMKRCIIDDITRFFRLHMWFRYLPLDGKEYLLFPWKGQQPKNAVEHDTLDTQGIHWWIWDSAFIDEIPISGVGKDILMRYRILLNCFIRGEEDNLDGSVHVKGWQAILNKYPRAQDILKRRHPSANDDVHLYFRYEMDSQIKQTLTAVKNILGMFQKNCPEWLRINYPDDTERRLNRNFSLDSLSFDRSIDHKSSASISSPSGGKGAAAAFVGSGVKRSRSTSGGLTTLQSPAPNEPMQQHHHGGGHKFSHLLHNIKSFRSGRDGKSASSEASLHCADRRDAEHDMVYDSTSETVEIDDLDAEQGANNQDNAQHPNRGTRSADTRSANKFSSLFRKKH